MQNYKSKTYQFITLKMFNYLAEKIKNVAAMSKFIKSFKIFVNKTKQIELHLAKTANK